MQQFVVEVVELEGVLALQSDAVIGHVRGDASARRVTGQICESHRKRLAKDGDGRQIARIAAGKMFAAGFEQAERALAARIELVLMFESRDQFVRRFAFQLCVLAKQPVVDALLFEAGDLAVQVTEQQQRDHAEQHQKQRGEAKAGGAVQFSQAHVACTPNRARYRSSEPSRPGRASS
ncbi:hypothetical protein HDG34_003978 [Paraburkholderia sp. HC6.4b]|uniref:hypothetical protein n=1 Tax=unclassified Paraburkholderia TaxID=2615204 RepID=UPI0018177A6E|nr:MULTISPECIES: hypothetical protein [unclassified Paraburkholderia]MBB5410025.1 hypothetical protein [Paraburkholderia sp. HC6.4b]MBB5452060.1 hypothetical protein [Paraburkholderia sp. Kb1A]